MLTADVLSQYVFFPTWLPPSQRNAFRDRCLRAFDRLEAKRGPEALADPRTRRRIIGGVAAAFKYDRLNSAWGRRMLAKRGARGLLRAIAEDGWQWREYFRAIGRRGAVRRKEAKQRKDLTRRLHTAVPPSQRKRTPAAKGWMEL